MNSLTKHNIRLTIRYVILCPHSRYPGPRVVQ